jgi:small subunit ribosomal protein S6
MIPRRMTLPAPTYDLVLMLDAEAEDEVRAKILADARAAITAQGELLRDDTWGDRALAYPIDHKATAKYHLLQFHAGNTELLEGLDRTLRIADEVVRFRIVKLKPGTPEFAGVAPATPEPTSASTPPAETAPAPQAAAPVAEAASEPPGASEPAAVSEPEAAAVSTPEPEATAEAAPVSAPEPEAAAEPAPAPQAAAEPAPPAQPQSAPADEPA